MDRSLDFLRAILLERSIASKLVKLQRDASQLQKEASHTCAPAAEANQVSSAMRSCSSSCCPNELPWRVDAISHMATQLHAHLCIFADGCLAETKPVTTLANELFWGASTGYDSVDETG
jgi:hypothetical protein